MSVTESLGAIRISLESAGIAMTPEQFDEITNYDEQYKYELVRGVLVASPIPSEGEAGPNEALGHLLLSYREQHPQGSCLDATLPERFVRTHDSRRRADRVVWAGLGRQPDPKSDTPTIVVEFVSVGKRDWSRDYVEKRKEYLELGVSEYWIIDRFRRTMTVYRQPPGSAEQMVPENGTYSTSLLPGFELPLARLLAVADAWAASENLKRT